MKLFAYLVFIEGFPIPSDHVGDRNCVGTGWFP
jgi:hypothetical protein